jgi:hypothetical protein
MCEAAYLVMSSSRSTGSTVPPGQNQDINCVLCYVAGFLWPVSRFGKQHSISLGAGILLGPVGTTTVGCMCTTCHCCLVHFCCLQAWMRVQAPL